MNVSLGLSSAVQMLNVSTLLEAMHVFVILVSVEMVSIAVSVLSFSFSQTSPSSLILSLSLGCTEGMVKLLNVTSGTNVTGTVGVCVSNNYRSICYDFWDQNDAQVVCSQLNITGCELISPHSVVDLGGGGVEGARPMTQKL